MSDLSEQPSDPTGWQEPPARTMGASVKRKVSVSIPLNDDGSPDWNSAQDRTKDRFREIFNHANTQSQFASSETQPETVPKPVAEAFLGTFFSMEALFFAYRWKIPLRDAQVICALKPDESDKLIPLVQSVAAKNGPEWLERWGDEIALGFMLVGASIARYMAVESVAKANQEKEVLNNSRTQASHVNDQEPIEAEVSAAIG